MELHERRTSRSAGSSRKSVNYASPSPVARALGDASMRRGLGYGYVATADDDDDERRETARNERKSDAYNVTRDVIVIADRATLERNQRVLTIVALFSSSRLDHAREGSARRHTRPRTLDD